MKSMALIAHSDLRSVETREVFLNHWGLFNFTYF